MYIVWAYLVIIVLIGVMFVFSTRNRRRQADREQQRVSQLEVGTEVMTTSGLYGTIVSRDDEAQTALLSVAPGVELKWALAALRPADALPPQYRKGIDGAGEEPEPGHDGPVDLHKDDQPGSGETERPS